MTESVFSNCSDCEHICMCWYLGKHDNHCVYYKSMRRSGMWLEKSFMKKDTAVDSKNLLPQAAMSLDWRLGNNIQKKWQDRCHPFRVAVVHKIQSRIVLDAVQHYEKNVVTLNRNFDRYVDMLVDDGSAEVIWKTFYDDNIRCDNSMCPLCKEYVHCIYCPVGKARHLHCDNTLWYDLARLCYDYKDIKSHRSAVLYVSKLRKAFEAELKFLKEVGIWTSSTLSVMAGIFVTIVLAVSTVGIFLQAGCSTSLSMSTSRIWSANMCNYKEV